MSAELTDLRAKITPETDRVLDAISAATGRDKSAIVRDVIAEWAAEQINVARHIFGAMPGLEAIHVPAAVPGPTREPLTNYLRAFVFNRDDGRCAYCFIALDKDGLYHIDHRLPVSRGGTNAVENLSLSCPECNLAKGSRTFEEFSGARNG